MADAPRQDLLRAASFGLALACLLGGLSLTGAGLWRLTRAPSCAGLGPQDCALARETSAELARYQLVAGGALALLGAGLLPLVRRRERR